MRLFAAFTIGVFFATCLLLMQPLYLFWGVPLLAPFAGGYLLAWLLEARGWLAWLAPRVTPVSGGLACLAALVGPVLIGMAVTVVAAQRLVLPSGIEALERSIGPDLYHVTFLAPQGIAELKAHFASHHGIRYWRDVPTPDPDDDPAALVQSATPSRSQGLWVLLSTRGDRTFVEIGGPHGHREPAWVIAGGGLAILLLLLLTGPPRQRRG